MKPEMANPYQLIPTHKLTMSKRRFNRFVEPFSWKASVNIGAQNMLLTAKHSGFDEVPVERVSLPYLGYSNPDDFDFSGY